VNACIWIPGCSWMTTGFPSVLCRCSSVCWTKWLGCWHQHEDRQTRSPLNPLRSALFPQTLNPKTQKTLILIARSFRVLDECDEMLNMGFVEDVEKILNAGGAEVMAQAQTLLFSATLPAWVKGITRKFLKADFKTIDLVGTEKMKARVRCCPSGLLHGAQRALTLNPNPKP
jgi:DEAD/DEAH box helicase